MHLAAAVGTQTIGLYGPGDPTRFVQQVKSVKRFDGGQTAPVWEVVGTICRFGEAGCMSKIRVTDVIQTLETAAYLTLNSEQASTVTN